MKKKVLVLLVLGLVALFASGVTGVAQGDLPEPKGISSLEVEGRKLVGTGMLGTCSVEVDGSVITVTFATTFWITNPDCVNDITIERLSIIRADGTLIYEGPLEAVIPYFEDGMQDPATTERILIPELPPHCQVLIELYNWMPHGGGWLDIWEAQQLLPHPYTVEIFYSGEGLDLIGEASRGTYYLTTTEGGTYINDERDAWSVPMVNMEQK